MSKLEVTPSGKRPPLTSTTIDVEDSGVVGLITFDKCEGLAELFKDFSVTKISAEKFVQSLRSPKDVELLMNCCQTELRIRNGESGNGKVKSNAN